MAWTEAHGELLQKTNREMESYQAQMLNVPTLSRTNNTLRPTGSTMSATSPPVRVWTGLTKAALPATGKQQKKAEQLLRDFPSSREVFEYEDYLNAPTRENASEFIT